MDEALAGQEEAHGHEAYGHAEEHHDDGQIEANQHHHGQNVQNGDQVEAQVSGPILGAPEIRLVASEWSFKPSVLTLHLGEAVNIVLVNDGVVEHDVAIPEMGIHLHALPGESAILGFVPDVAGEFELVCTLPGHYEAGMHGQVRVEG